MACNAVCSVLFVAKLNQCFTQKEMQMCIMWSCDYVMWSCDYVVGIITSLVMMNICECISLVLTTDDQQSQSLGLGTSRQFRATTFCIWGCIQPAVEIRGALRITSHGAELGSVCGFHRCKSSGRLARRSVCVLLGSRCMSLADN